MTLKHGFSTPDLVVLLVPEISVDRWWLTASKMGRDGDLDGFSFYYLLFIWMVNKTLIWV